MSDTDQRQLPWAGETALALPTQANFAPHEHWAWAHIIRGQIANMSRYPGDDVDPQSDGWLEGVDDEAGFDPADTDGWPAHRVLSERFLRTIYFHAPWASALERPTINIWCAKIEDEVDWQGRQTRGEMRFFRCRFVERFSLRGARIAGILDLQGCQFDDDFMADGLNVAGDLFMRNGVVAHGGTRLLGATIDGDLDFSASTFHGALYVNKAIVRGDLLCTEEFHAHDAVVFRGAQIGDTADFTSAKFEGDFFADRLTAQGSLYCRRGFRATGTTYLLGARIASQADFSSSRFDGDISADGMSVGGDFYMRDMEHLGAANLQGVSVGQDLQLRGSTIDGVVDLTGARITGELHLAYSDDAPGPTWGPEARLVLRNAQAGALAGSINSLMAKDARGRARPVPCDLSGFQYERLGGLGASAGETLASAKSSALIGLLGTRARGEDKRLDAQPYLALASALDEAGRRQKADRIRVSAGNHELFAKDTGLLRRLALAMSWLFVGYGHRNWRAGLWFLASVLGGAALGLHASGDTSPELESMLRWFWFSADNAIPVVELDAGHREFLAARLGADDASLAPVGIASAFHGLKLFGFLVLTYLAAGVTGLAAGARR